MSQLGITYRARDIFLVLPEGVDPELMAHISKDTGALDPQKELGPDFFKLLGKGILKVRVKTGAVPLVTQPPVSTSPPPGTCVLSGDEPRDLEHLYVLLHETMHDTIYDRVGTKAKFFPRELTPVVSAKMFAPEIADTSVPRRVCVLVGPWCIGKTTILLQIAAEAEKKGFVPLYIDFEASTEFPRTAAFVASFVAYVVRNKRPEKCMLFLDEVWKLQGWESVLKEVAENFRVSCAVASSTFTTERLLVTKTMADCNILYHVSPLFFSECVSMSPGMQLTDYLRLGGFPSVQRARFHVLPALSLHAAFTLMTKQQSDASAEGLALEFMRAAQLIESTVDLSVFGRPVPPDPDDKNLKLAIEATFSHNCSNFFCLIDVSELGSTCEEREMYVADILRKLHGRAVSRLAGARNVRLFPVLLGSDEDIPPFLSLRSLLLQPQLPERAPVELNAMVLADGRMQWVVSTNRVVWNRRTGASTVLSEWSRVPRDDCKDVQGLAGAIGRCCRLREYYTVLQSAPQRARSPLTQFFRDILQ
eukprot:m51a1_g12055 hypothetical protein (533) ;mRNA; f:1288-3783